MAICRRCGIEIKVAVDLEPEFCEACIEDFLDDEDAYEEDDGVTCTDDYSLPRLRSIADEPN